MKISSYLLSAGLVSLLVAVPAVAQETGWLERTPGFTGDIMGVRVESVENIPGEDRQKILVSVPTSAIAEESVIEEVLVTAPGPDDLYLDWNSPEPPRYEFVKDYDNDRYGFVIYIGRNKDLPFRIHFMADDSQPLRGVDQ